MMFINFWDTRMDGDGPPINTSTYWWWGHKAES